MKPGATGLTRIIKACGYSLKGLAAAWKHEAAFRQELILALILLPLAFVVGQSAGQIALLIMTLGFVMVTELVNSAIEAVVDRFGGEIHELSGRAKDMGSACVFIAILTLSAVWLTLIVYNFIL